jgi:hypothetical protein
MTTNPNEIEAAVLRVIETYADSYVTMSNIGDGRVRCTSVAVDLRRNIADGIKEAFAASARGVADGWQPIETMPSGKWVFVYVPGVSGSGVEAIKKPDVSGAFWAGRIISLQTGREITRATHWRAAIRPPEGSPLSDNSLYAVPSSPAATPVVDVSDRVKALDDAATYCKRVADETQWLDDTPEAEREQFKQGVMFCSMALRDWARRESADAALRTPPAPAGEGNPDANDMAEADAEVERILAMSDEEVMEGVTPEEIAKMRRDIDRLSRTFAAGRRTGFIAGRDAAAGYVEAYQPDWGACTGDDLPFIAQAIRAIEPGEIFADYANKSALDMVELLRLLIAVDAEAPGGLLDCTDSDGGHYQSAQLAGLIAHAKGLVPGNSVADRVAAFRAIAAPGEGGNG